VLRIEDGVVKQKGTLDKKIDLPFSVKGAVEATPDGRSACTRSPSRAWACP
jgi:hypothetical protein